MKANDIYNFIPIKTTNNLYYLTNGWHPHIPEIENHRLVDNADDLNTRIEIRIYFDPYIDGERCCTVGAAFLDKQPVMIFRHGGRGGHDSYDRFITNYKLYQEMVAYLRTLCMADDIPDEIVDPTHDLDDYEVFYGYSFDPKKSLAENKLVEPTNEDMSIANAAVTAVAALVFFGMRPYEANR
jgi:hypothetical protein